MSNPGAAQPRNRWATAALVVGIAAAGYVVLAVDSLGNLVNNDDVVQTRIVAWVFVVLPIAAIALGVAGRRAARRAKGRGARAATAGVVLGVVTAPLAVLSMAVLLGCAMDAIHCR